MKNSVDPYAHVNWKKAQEQFRHPVPSGSRLSTRDLLLTIAYFGAEAIVDLMEVNRRIASSLHPGLIDPECETWRSNQLLKQFERQRYIILKKDLHGRNTVQMTKRGIRRALTYNLDTMTIAKPTIWDRKWRVVIFDIPVRYGRIRNIFRMRLKQLGLKKLQESVYVSPYPCFDEIEFLRELYGVAFTVQYILAEQIEDDGQLLQYFHHPR